jgi:type IV pilus assembly protein PilA
MVIRKTIREQGDRQSRSRGFSLIELLVVIAIILVIAALAIPNFLRAKISANQAGAASTVRTINTASAQYQASWNNGYPPSLAALGTVGASATCNGAMVLDPTLTTAPNQKSGYTFAYTPQGASIPSPPAGCGAGYSSYLITAVPTTALTGTVSYCSDESNVLHVDGSGALAASPAACDSLPAVQ